MALLCGPPPPDVVAPFLTVFPRAALFGGETLVPPFFFNLEVPVSPPLWFGGVAIGFALLPLVCWRPSRSAFSSSASVIPFPFNSDFHQAVSLWTCAMGQSPPSIGFSPLGSFGPSCFQIDVPRTDRLPIGLCSNP